MIAFHGLGEITVHPGVHIDNLIQLDHLKTVSEPQQISMQLVTRHYKHQQAVRPTSK